MKGGLMVVDRFLFETLACRLRHAFDRFASAGRPASIWAVQFGRHGGYFLRARPEAVLPAEDLGLFVDAVRDWSVARLGLARVSVPVLDLHPGGAHMPVASDRRGGRLSYQYFLTGEGAMPGGGATIFAGEERASVDPLFNRLAVFDGRAANGVARVEGRNRIALTGTIRESGPLISGGLTRDQLWPGLEPVLRRFFDEYGTVVRTHDGVLVIGCRIGSDGRVTDYEVKLDRVLAPGDGEEWRQALASLETGFRSAVFAGAAQETELVLPLSFGLALAEEAEGENAPAPPMPRGGDRSILSQVARRRPRDARLLNDIVTASVREGDLETAADFAARHALLVRGSEWVRGEAEPLPLDQGHYLTPLKIAHDIEQLNHLRRHGRIGSEFDEVIAAYQRTLERCAGRGPDERIPLAEIEEERVRAVDGRILHLRHTPRVPGAALSESWGRRKVEDGYLDHSLGIMVIDDFLTAPAWRELLSFCQDSTVWFANRYRNGRLGAFFREGFNCPLLIQIAEEIRDAFPRVIGRKHALEHMWGYKYNPIHDRGRPHADFAAVNVNFWITPDQSNLDPDHGGLIIYDKEAPPEWEFADYNMNGRKITSFISETGAKSIEIPYRSNRAIIFNSDLFHVTADCKFREEYEDRRMNVTMLYGRRGDA